MKIVAIIQARMNSERLPGKVLRKLNDTPIIEIIVERVKLAKRIDEVIVATSLEKSDDELAQYCLHKQLNVFRGDLNNVLERFYQCATKVNADIIIRLTGDNPFVDGGLIDEAIDRFRLENVDYLKFGTNLPLGMGIEVFTYESLKKAYDQATNSECLEHVTPFMYKNQNIFRCAEIAYSNFEENKDIRLTVDTEADFEVAHKIFENIGRIDFTYERLIDCLKENYDWLKINSSVCQKKVLYEGE